jgi:holo-[acyl-carrier protein] synthase
MLSSIGIDIIEIKKMQELIRNYPSKLNSIFTPAELSFCKANGFKRFSLIFAAKEASLKALDTGWEKGRDLLDVEIIPLNNGQFKVRLSGRLKQRAKKLSIKEQIGSFSGTRDIAIAQVLSCVGFS